MIKIGINGFGRIGRLAFRAMVKDPAIEVVAVNDLGDIPTMAHLLKYDSVHGRAFDTVEVTEEGFVADGYAVKVLSERDPNNLPWGELGVDVVLDCTGKFRSAPDLRRHIECGAKKVVLSAPAKGEIDGGEFAANVAQEALGGGFAAAGGTAAATAVSIGAATLLAGTTAPLWLPGAVGVGAAVAAGSVIKSAWDGVAGGIRDFFCI